MTTFSIFPFEFEILIKSYLNLYLSHNKEIIIEKILQGFERFLSVVSELIFVFCQ